MTFRKAERTKIKLRLALDGHSGSGKTMSALFICAGIGGKTALIDTESGRGELYADSFDYDVAPLNGSYEPQKYIALIKEAEKAGYANLIIDSLSHAWEGTGGILEMHDNKSKNPKVNSFTAWREVTPIHNQLINAILGSSLNLLITLRTKVAYEMTEEFVNNKKKVQVQKVGTKPIQREGLDYEFMLVFDLDQDHIAFASKDNTGLFDGKPHIITAETGKQLVGWLNSGKDRSPETPPPPKPPQDDGLDSLKEILKGNSGSIETAVQRTVTLDEAVEVAMKILGNNANKTRIDKIKKEKLGEFINAVCDELMARDTAKEEIDAPQTDQLIPE